MVCKSVGHGMLDMTVCMVTMMGMECFLCKVWYVWHVCLVLYVW